MKIITENIKPILALTIVVYTLGFYLTVTILQIKPDPDIKTALYALAFMCVGYYFGSSTGGAKKDETINNLIEKQNERNV